MTKINLKDRDTIQNKLADDILIRIFREGGEDGLGNKVNASHKPLDLQIEKRKTFTPEIVQFFIDNEGWYVLDLKDKKDP